MQARNIGRGGGLSLSPLFLAANIFTFTHRKLNFEGVATSLPSKPTFWGDIKKCSKLNKFNSSF